MEGTRGDNWALFPLSGHRNPFRTMSKGFVYDIKHGDRKEKN